LSTLQTFFEMGGHGLYIWLCYGVGGIIFLLLGVSPMLARRRVIKQVKQLHRRLALAPAIPSDVNEKE
jgi:heme exporter protein D